MEALPDGETYARITPDGKRIVAYYYKDGKEARTLFDVGATIGSKVSAFDDYILSPDGKRMLIATGKKAIYRRSSTATYYIYNIENRRMEPLSDNGAVQNPIWSNDGNLVAFVRNNNMDFNVDDQMASEDHAISGSLTIPCKESDAILVSMDEGKTYDDCHTFTPPTEEEETATVATVTFDEETVFFKVAGGEETPYSLNAERPLVTVFAHTFKLKANQDPDHPEDYYSTFFTSEGAYKLPTTKVSAKAYTGTVDGENLNMTDAGSIIPQNEAVILKATGSSIVLLPSARQLEASSENDLEGTDKEMQLGSNQYALSLGQNGVGFYLWDGKEIGANKAYLTLSEEADAKSFTFIFDDDPINAIQELTPAISESEEATYNLNGMRVGKDYKGIVIKNGKKVLMK